MEPPLACNYTNLESQGIYRKADSYLLIRTQIEVVLFVHFYEALLHPFITKAKRKNIES